MNCHIPKHLWCSIEKPRFFFFQRSTFFCSRKFVEMQSRCHVNFPEVTSGRHSATVDIYKKVGTCRLAAMARQDSPCWNPPQFFFCGFLAGFVRGVERLTAKRGGLCDVAEDLSMGSSVIHLRNSFLSKSISFDDFSRSKAALQLYCLHLSTMKVEKSGIVSQTSVGNVPVIMVGACSPSWLGSSWQEPPLQHPSFLVYWIYWWIKPEVPNFEGEPFLISIQFMLFTRAS